MEKDICMKLWCNFLTLVPSGFMTAGYVELKDVFKYGAVMAVWNILVWTVAGGLWWKAIGLY